MPFSHPVYVVLASKIAHVFLVHPPSLPTQWAKPEKLARIPSREPAEDLRGCALIYRFIVEFLSRCTCFRRQCPCFPSKSCVLRGHGKDHLSAARENHMDICLTSEAALNTPVRCTSPPQFFASETSTTNYAHVTTCLVFVVQLCKIRANWLNLAVFHTNFMLF